MQRWDAAIAGDGQAQAQAAERSRRDGRGLQIEIPQDHYVARSQRGVVEPPAVPGVPPPPPPPASVQVPRHAQAQQAAHASKLSHSQQAQLTALAHAAVQSSLSKAPPPPPPPPAAVDTQVGVKDEAARIQRMQSALELLARYKDYTGVDPASGSDKRGEQLPPAPPTPRDLPRVTGADLNRQLHMSQPMPAHVLLTNPAHSSASA